MYFILVLNGFHFETNHLGCCFSVIGLGVFLVELFQFPLVHYALERTLSILDDLAIYQEIEEPSETVNQYNLPEVYSDCHLAPLLHRLSVRF